MVARPEGGIPTLAPLEGLRARIASLDRAGAVTWLNGEASRLRDTQTSDTITATAVGANFIEACRRSPYACAPAIVEGLRAVLARVTTYVELNCDLAVGGDRMTQLTITPSPADPAGALVMQVDVRPSVRVPPPAAAAGSAQAPRPVVPRALDVLTARERMVLRLMARGLDNHSIAKELDLTYATVRSHVRSIMAKLDARSRLEAVVRAVQLDLIDLPRAEGATPARPARL